jgi:uncharacterized membrane protein
MLACALLASGPALAVSYTFAALPPGFNATALNDVGQVAGTMASPASTLPLPVVYAGNTVTVLLRNPTFGGGIVAVTGINDAGDVLLNSVAMGGSSPFALFGGVETGIALPSGALNGGFGNAINTLRQVVGGSVTVAAPGSGQFSSNAFIASGGTAALLRAPGSVSSDATGINDAGLIVGTFVDATSGYVTKGFLDDGGTFTTITVPGATTTLPVAINDAGEIAGTYSDAAGQGHGFVDVGGAFSDVAGPGGDFLPVGLNNLGQLVGTFGGTGLSYIATPQVATVPEPATAALLGGSLLALASLRRRR